MSISNKNAASKPHEYLNLIYIKSVSLAYARCIKMMFHSKGKQKRAQN